MNEAFYGRVVEDMSSESARYEMIGQHLDKLPKWARADLREMIPRGFTTSLALLEWAQKPDKDDPKPVVGMDVEEKPPGTFSFGGQFDGPRYAIPFSSKRAEIKIGCGVCGGLEIEGRLLHASTCASLEPAAQGCKHPTAWVALQGAPNRTCASCGVLLPDNWKPAGPLAEREAERKAKDPKPETWRDRESLL